MPLAFSDRLSLRCADPSMMCRFNFDDGHIVSRGGARSSPDRIQQRRAALLSTSRWHPSQWRPGPPLRGLQGLAGCQAAWSAGASSLALASTVSGTVTIRRPSRFKI
jgi:hypothetical protein